MAMASFDTQPASTRFASDPASQGELFRLMREICRDTDADHYMIVELARERGRQYPKIITSNWVFDAIEALGCEAIEKILDSALATDAGRSPLPLDVAMMNLICARQSASLREHGHGELYCLKLQTGKRRVYALLTSGTPGKMNVAAVWRAQMVCSYAISRHLAATANAATADRLSDRERECLRWASEGKTTDEVAVILGVSSNTVNSYVANAIQKIGASNRAMAIATAIRNGII